MFLGLFVSMMLVCQGSECVDLKDYEIKGENVCGYKLQRNFRCENACFDINMKLFRASQKAKGEKSPEEWGTFEFDEAINDWNNFKTFKDKKTCDCNKKYQIQFISKYECKDLNK